VSSVSFDNLPRAHELRLAQRHVRGVVCVCVCGPCSARMNSALPDLWVIANVETRKTIISSSTKSTGQLADWPV